MGRRCRRLLGLLMFAAAASGCNFPRPSVQPLEMPTFPAQPSLGPVGGETTVPGVTTVPGTPVALETPAFEPEPMVLCTTGIVWLRAGPSTADPQLDLIPAGYTVTRLSPEAPQADGYTWHNVEVGGQTGWMASEWFRLGDCNTAVSGGETPTIIDSPTDDWGNTWEDPATHFGIDISSVTGNNSLHAPYTGTVIAQDACAACADELHTDGNRQGQHNEQYNYGYGSMIILEYRYEDLSEQDLRELAEDGIEIGEGESLYMMVAHLDPRQAALGTGTEVQPGDTLATVGNSGNSFGIHAHVEAVVNDSGLSLSEDQSTFWFWEDTVVERPSLDRPGLRFDPSPLFDLDG